MPGGVELQYLHRISHVCKFSNTKVITYRSCNQAPDRTIETPAGDLIIKVMNSVNFSGIGSFSRIDYLTFFLYIFRNHKNKTNWEKVEINPPASHQILIPINIGSVASQMKQDPGFFRTLLLMWSTRNRATIKMPDRYSGFIVVSSA